MEENRTTTEVLNAADSRVRKGEIREAAALLETVKLSGLTRTQTLKMAGLLRRVGLAEQGLALLAPYVRPRKALTAPATAAEMAEYAICLQRIGSLNEGEQLLKEVDFAQAPEALLYRSIMRFSVWDYEGAIPYLQALVGMTGADVYLLQAARLNLGAALTTEGRFEEAIDILFPLLESTHKREEWLLHCNALEVLSQSQILSGQYKEAKSTLEKAGRLISGIKVLDKLYLIKWTSLLEAFQSGSAAPLAPAREEAWRKRHFETLRDLDFYALKLNYDPGLHLKLHFGSASPFFRKRLATHFGSHPLPEEAAIHSGWEFRPVTGPALNPFFDLKDELAPGTVAHALTMALLSDVYKAFRTGELYSLLFPGDFFNPDTSLNRIHQAVRRTRQALKDQLPALAITGDKVSYSIEIGTLPQPLLSQPALDEYSPAGIRFQIFRKSLPEARFVSEQVQSAFGISKSAANKLIKSWRDYGYVELDVAGKSPVYLARR